MPLFCTSHEADFCEQHCELGWGDGFRIRQRFADRVKMTEGCNATRLMLMLALGSRFLKDKTGEGRFERFEPLGGSAISEDE